MNAVKSLCGLFFKLPCDLTEDNLQRQFYWRTDKLDIFVGQKCQTVGDFIWFYPLASRLFLYNFFLTKAGIQIK